MLLHAEDCHLPINTGSYPGMLSHVEDCHLPINTSSRTAIYRYADARWTAT